MIYLSPGVKSSWAETSAQQDIARWLAIGQVGLGSERREMKLPHGPWQGSHNLSVLQLHFPRLQIVISINGYRIQSALFFEMADPLGLAASLAGVLGAAKDTSSALKNYLQRSDNADEELRLIEDDMGLLNLFLHETTTIFLSSDSHVPRSAEEAFRICQWRQEVLSEVLYKRMGRFSDSKPQRLLRSLKYPTKKVMSSFRSYKESVGVLRDIAAM